MGKERYKRKFYIGFNEKKFNESFIGILLNNPHKPNFELSMLPIRQEFKLSCRDYAIESKLIKETRVE